MYNIHINYQNILSLIKKSGVNHGILGYLFPFGSTHIDNVEFISIDNTYTPDKDIQNRKNIFFLCYDQEPLIYDYNQELFFKIQKLITKKTFIIPQNHYDSSADELLDLGSSKLHNSDIHIFNSVRLPEHIQDIKYSPLVLLNTEKNSKEKNKIIEKYNFIDCYYFFHGLAAADWYRGYQYCSDILPLKERIVNKKFISFNRITGNARVHRSFLVAELVKRNLISNGHISYSRQCPVHGDLKQSLLTAKKKYDLSSDYVNSVLSYLTKDLQNDLRIDTPLNEIISNDSYTIGPIDQSIESFLHVVTETCFWDFKQHLTEKIFKPIVLKQPFVLVGCANNLSYLKEYGFKTFDRWWDESYDLITDPVQRINRICDIIENICKLSNQELQNLLLEMEEVLEHNYNRFYSKEFVNDIWNELSVNLQLSIDQSLRRISAKK